MTNIIRQRRPTPANLAKLDFAFEKEAYSACSQVMVVDWGHPRPYALVSLEYRSVPQLFAVPLRSNIRWDTPSKWFLPTPKRATTLPGNHAGFDLRKMVPVPREAVTRFQVIGDPLPAQFALARGYESLKAKAQAYLAYYEAETDPFYRREDCLVDIDSVIDEAFPRFAKAA